MSKKEQLIQCFTNAYNYKINYVAILVKLPDGSNEVIINKRENALEKLNYYKNAYDEDLKLNSNKEIEIVDFCCGSSFADIEYDLLS